MQGNTLYVGLDVHKLTISVSVAAKGRNGAVRFIGTIANTALSAPGSWPGMPLAALVIQSAPAYILPC